MTEEARGATSMDAGETRRPRRWAAPGSAAAVYLVAAVGVFHSAWAHPRTRLIGICCDSTGGVWFLKWMQYAVLHGLNPLFTHRVGGDAGVNVLWQPPGVPLLGFVTIPVQSLFGPFVTYNLVITLGAAGSAFAAWIALRSWVGGWIGPLIGGLVYGFSPFVMGHAYGHPSFEVAFVTPLFLLVVTRLLAGRGSPVRNGVFLGLLFAAQFLIGQEELAGMAVASAVLTVILALLHRDRVRDRVRPVATGVGVAAAVGLGVCAVPLAAQFLGGQQLQGRLRDPDLYVTDLANVFVPNPGQGYFAPGAAAAYARAWNWSIAENTAYLGPALLVVGAIALLRRRLAVVVGLLGAAAMLVLSLGPHLHIANVNTLVPLPWRVLQDVPLIESALPTRLSMFVFLGVAVVVAEGVEAAWSAWAVRHQPVGLAALAGIGVLLVVAFLPPAHYPAWQPEIPSWFSSAAARSIPEGSDVFMVPVPRDAPPNAQAALWQVTAGMRFDIEAGFVLVPPADGQHGLPPTGGTPDELTARFDDLAAGKPPVPPSADELASLRAFFARTYHPDAVVLGPMPGHDEALRLLTDLLGPPTTTSGGVEAWLPGRFSLAR